MEKVRKVIKINNTEPIDNENLNLRLSNAQTEHEKVKKLIDMFILALFLIFIMYTTI